jgi:putative FmdB family regulatory protein
MPLYEYQCQECDRRTEKIQKLSAPDLTVCPYCGGRLERTLTAAAVQFKGGGWYKDLYSSAKPTAATASGADAAGSKGSDTAASKPTESATPAPSTSTASATSAASNAPATGDSSKT